MFSFRSPGVAGLPPCSSKSTKRFTKHIRNTSSAFADNISNTLKRASRRTLSNNKEIHSELCPTCVEYVLDRSEDPVHDIHLVTSLSLTFDGLCPQQELHVAEILCVVGFYHLELIDAQPHRAFTRYSLRGHGTTSSTSPANLLSSVPSFVPSPPSDTCSDSRISRSPDTQTTTWVRGQEVLHPVQALSTAAPLLLHSQLDDTSLRHLEYNGGG